MAKEPETKAHVAKRHSTRVDPERLRMVEKLLAACVPRKLVVKEVVAQYGVSRQTAYSYINRVIKDWTEDSKEVRNYERHRSLRNLNLIIQKAIAKDKLAAAVRAVEVKMKLLGLAEAEEVIVHTPDSHPTEAMTSAQIRAYLQEKADEREQLKAELRAAEDSVH